VLPQEAQFLAGLLEVFGVSQVQVEVAPAVAVLQVPVVVLEQVVVSSTSTECSVLRLLNRNWLSRRLALTELLAVRS
jgi:hypothetical protein